MSTSFLPSFGEITTTLFCMGNSNKNLDKPRTLSKDFFEQLCKLETEYFHNKHTVETLDLLVQHYTKAVEFYDTLQDEISGYFSWKISDILTNRKSLGMLLHKNSGDNSKETTAAGSLPLSGGEFNPPAAGEFDHDDLTDDETEKVKRVEWEKKKKERDSVKSKKSLETLKQEKQRQANFFYTVEAHKKKQKDNMDEVLDKHNSSAHLNDKHVSGNINKQKDRLKKRLEQKRSHSFATYALNLSMNSSFGGDRKSIGNINEPILKKDILNDSYISNSSNILDGNDENDIKSDLIALGFSDEPVTAATTSSKNLSNIPPKKSLFKRQGTVNRDQDKEQDIDDKFDLADGLETQKTEEDEVRPKITRGGSRKFTL